MKEIRCSQCEVLIGYLEKWQDEPVSYCMTCTSKIKSFENRVANLEVRKVYNERTKIISFIVSDHTERPFKRLIIDFTLDDLEEVEEGSLAPSVRIRKGENNE